MFDCQGIVRLLLVLPGRGHPLFTEHPAHSILPSFHLGWVATRHWLFRPMARLDWSSSPVALCADLPSN